MGHYKEAIESLEKAISLEPRMAEARLNLGAIYLRAKNKPGALAQYHVLKTLDHKMADRLYGLLNEDMIVSVNRR